MKELTNIIQTPELNIFIDEIIENWEVWFLQTPEWIAVVESQIAEWANTMLLWSTITQAEEWAKNGDDEDDTTYEPVCISVEDFVGEWMPQIISDKIFIGYNWNEESYPEIEADLLMLQLHNKLSEESQSAE